MPSTVIAIGRGDDGVRIDIAIPLPELRLALPESIPQDAGLLSEFSRSAVLAYVTSHCSVRSATGVPQPVLVQSAALSETVDTDVGLYQELGVRLFVAAAPGFDPRDFTLAYDAVIHQVANHFAVVQVTQDFRTGVLDSAGATEVGLIRFDFQTNTTPPLRVAAGRGSLWRGSGAALGLGFHHVLGGFDHLLFLVTLLIVAPLRPVQGHWSLFQGWPYTLRRFLAISLAFTIGHSVALYLGTYAVLPVPMAAIEVLIAASIVLTAAHAVRPLFTGREWAVATLFGVVHGLAFSESLTRLDLPRWPKALTVLGFNLGVEGAQLVAMACAVPVLVFSRWPMFHRLRVVTMVGAVVLAGTWLIERARALP